MRKLKQIIYFFPFIRKIFKYFIKKRFANKYYSKKLKLINKWAWQDNEDSNFYYEIDKLNQKYLASTISLITGIDIIEIEKYFNELIRDELLRKTLNKNLTLIPEYGKDIKIAYGRRIGWYALVRILKPKTIIETGVSHGVGSCVLASALLRNKEEGFNGRYYGTDISPTAGRLISEPYKSVSKIIYGDSIKTLEKINFEIDFFINDSDHSTDYEFKEYTTIKNKLSKNAYILGDNSHDTDCLYNFSNITNRNFIFYSEKPSNHWYPGAGIGISFPKNIN